MMGCSHLSSAQMSGVGDLPVGPRHVVPRPQEPAPWRFAASAPSRNWARLPASTGRNRRRWSGPLAYDADPARRGLFIAASALQGLDRQHGRPPRRQIRGHRRACSPRRRGGPGRLHLHRGPRPGAGLRVRQPHPRGPLRQPLGAPEPDIGWRRFRPPPASGHRLASGPAGAWRAAIRDWLQHRAAPEIRVEEGRARLRLIPAASGPPGSPWAWSQLSARRASTTLPVSMGRIPGRCRCPRMSQQARGRASRSRASRAGVRVAAAAGGQLCPCRGRRGVSACPARR